jgi:hypothetical protein
MSRVRLTGPYRYLIYVTPDYAIVVDSEGLDLGTGQEAMRISLVDFSFQIPLVLEKYSMVTTNKTKEQQRRDNNSFKCLLCIHYCR